MAWSWQDIGIILGGTDGGTSKGGVLSSGGFLGSTFQDLTGQTPTYNQWSSNARTRSHQQSEGLGLLKDWAFTGEGPSAAQSLIDMNRQQNAANMIGSAKSMPGGNPALANQLAAEGIARGNAQATLQGVQLRSAEQQQAMSNYMTGLQGARQLDQDMYQKKLEAEQKNTAGRQAFIGGIMNPLGGLMGGGL